MNSRREGQREGEGDEREPNGTDVGNSRRKEFLSGELDLQLEMRFSRLWMDGESGRCANYVFHDTYIVQANKPSRIRVIVA